MERYNNSYKTLNRNFYSFRIFHFFLPARICVCVCDLSSFHSVYSPFSSMFPFILVWIDLIFVCLCTKCRCFGWHQYNIATTTKSRKSTHTINSSNNNSNYSTSNNRQKGTRGKKRICQTIVWTSNKTHIGNTIHSSILMFTIFRCIYWQKRIFYIDKCDCEFTRFGMHEVCSLLSLSWMKKNNDKEEEERKKCPS